MTDKSPVDREEVIQLDLPQKSLKDGLMGLFFRQYSILASVLAEVQDVTDPRIGLLTDLIINTIPDDEYREQLRNEKIELKNSKIKEATAKNNGDEIPNEFKAELARDAYLETIGKVSSFLDTAVGLSHKLEVRVE